ncbi:MAG: NfeD family protein [Tenuifilaceae bacterium]|jgi:membrane-bound serine protease (ClpP class)|nr:NfeD family protein [Tenuifilaceae bacterium]
MNQILRLFWLTALYLISSTGFGSNDSISETKSKLIYKINIKEDIMPAAWRITQRGFDEASEQNADVIIIHMNTYGGMVNMADSIRTKILNSTIPVWVFIDNQAASAGALISIAADSIYMRQGGSIGAATVVNQTGEVAPDKFQSFMRSTMRATAEAKGKIPVVVDGDTIYKWRRDPRIAEAMVDPSVYIEGIIDDDKVLTFTTEEAIRWGYCEGSAETVAELIDNVGIKDYKLVEFKPTLIDKIIGLLTSPVISGLLIMLIVGGIYFELQTPGVGFPLAVAVLGAILYFAPLYIEGMAEHYELIIFIVGLILIAVEVFALPGFGVAGISGIILVIIGLTVALIDNDIFRDVRPFSWIEVLQPLALVAFSILAGLIGSIILSRKLITSPAFPSLALNSSLTQEEGYIGVDKHQKDMLGKTGIAVTVLRPSGKVQIDDEIFDAVSDEGFINKNEEVKVIKDEAGQIYVMRKN